MTLDTYLRRNDAKKLTALSVALGVSKGRLSQLRNSTDWPPDLALKVEEATDGAVNASDICSIVERARQTGAAA